VEAASNNALAIQLRGAMGGMIDLSILANLSLAPVF